MKRIKNQWLIGTKYGINLLIETYDGEYYQQIHSTLCHDGGGAATWVKLALDETDQPQILNPITKPD